MHRVWSFVANYSLLMIAGAALALLWANLDPHGYHAVVDWVILAGSPVGEPIYAPDGSVASRTLTFHYLVNDVLMAFFFAIAAKEVWEAIILRDGSLRGRSALVPVLSALGGMAGPVAIYLLLAAALGSETYDALAHGWAVPTATDIAFSYIVARIIFGAGHPAVRFLLLLAIVDDALGLLIIAVFYPKGDLAPEWLLLSLGAAVGAWLLFNWLPRALDGADPRKPRATWMRRRLSFWPYLAAGALSWFGFQEAGVHPALGLLPIIPAMPHADRGFGIFAEAERHLRDVLNSFEHALKTPVEFVLFLFGLLNAGVEFAAAGAPTWLVLIGLLVGKPIGILGAGWLGVRTLRLGLPKGMEMRDVLVVGFVAAIGFTVALFVAGVAFSPEATLAGHPIQDAAKLGALLSVVAGPIAWVVGRMTGVRRQA
ncbi:Na+/H+ antiporter NhaA [Rubellimicrobium aerolatum]|uniref:Na(+)/H(+) antiporter NhaA n=1 Tax=Rubellimicrobium aerolatum TaxID=490979 RepID=A0ABW0SG30_9RHOB|nr:Na+/H+ antiporter NhaA [Rubellimicrobium aerolatum]MBP1805805.1 NhaA family Na+:H+ antiporter [Rubellimicrobium aerolatum]